MSHRAIQGLTVTDFSALFPNAPPEEILAMRLEAVFMPEARRLRDKFYRSNSDPRFVHYTNVAAAHGILEKKRLWLRNTTAMVDYGEVRHGLTLLSRWFNTGNNRKEFLGAFDEIHAGAAANAIELFDNTMKRTDVGLHTQTYIGSVSEHKESENEHGRLSMWRAFGGDASARVALVLRVPLSSKSVNYLGCYFSPVVYSDSDSADGIFSEIVQLVSAEYKLLKSLSYEDLRNWIYLSFVVAITCVKHSGFKEEREWRIVYSPGYHLKGPGPSLIESEIIIVGGIPQIIYKFPIDGSLASEIAHIDLAVMFDRLILGPTQYSWVLYDAFKRKLEQIGIADAGARIITSKIPIRT
jgi:Protein of unknown function (DUF2971)